MLRTYHRMIIDLDGEIPAPVVAGRSRAAAVRPRVATAGASRMRVDEAFVDEWSHEQRDYEAVGGAGVFGVPQFDPGARPRRLGRRRDRGAGGRLPEAPRRLGPRLAARRAASLAPAGARAVAPPRELPPLRRPRRDDGGARRRQREPDRRDAPLRARRHAHPLARRRLAQGASRGVQADA